MILDLLHDAGQCPNPMPSKVVLWFQRPSYPRAPPSPGRASFQSNFYDPFVKLLEQLRSERRPPPAHSLSAVKASVAGSRRPASRQRVAFWPRNTPTWPAAVAVHPRSVRRAIGMHEADLAHDRFPAFHFDDVPSLSSRAPP